MTGETITCTWRINREARDWMKQFIPEGKSGYGHYVSRLILEERAREEERQLLAQQVLASLKR